MAFTYEGFVAAVQEAASGDKPAEAVGQLMRETLADPAAVAAAIPPRDEDEVHLFEDGAVSIWNCRFQSDVVVPPHEHKMPVWIGVISGAEKNIFYRRDDDGLHEIGTRVIRPGEVVAIGDDAIHAVTAEGDEPSDALHVYLGELTAVERDLFDWFSGEAVEFTMDNFEKMKKIK
ncbi:MAG: hypothetical protein AAGH99_06880 [Planctomycetota bacterium]